MNLTITKEQILHGLQSVQNIISSRTTLPILSNVLLRAEENRLELKATDLDVTISCVVEANVKQAGQVTLPCKKFFSIARELGSPEIELSVDDKNVCSISAGPSFYKINGLSAEEYPPMTNFGEGGIVVLPQEKIKGMLRKTAYAASVEESRYVLNGIYVSFGDNKMTMAATDGRRLALVDEEVEVSEDKRRELIIPNKAVNELNRLLQDKGEVEIRVNENQIAFNLKDEKGFPTVIVSKLIEGSYPNYRQVIPSETRVRINLSREELLAAMRRAEIMTSEKSNSVKFTFTKNNLTITANSPEVGEARESIAINFSGKEFAIAFNPKFVIDPLTALAEDEVFLELIDELSPGVFKINGPFIYVVMPMRLG